MARKPSERRNFQDDETELNLTPMMNLISILIPLLLASMAFVEIAILKVSAPQISSGGPTEQEENPEKPLNLTVMITDTGYRVKANAAVGDQNYAAEGIQIPLKEKELTCAKYIGTVPPPRKENKQRGECTEAESASSRTWNVYDLEELQKRLLEIKKLNEKEDKIMIGAAEHIEFEAIVDVMDASREYKQETDETKTLFPTVVMTAGIGG